MEDEIARTELQKVIPGSRNGTYEALKRGDIDNFRIGDKILIPTAPLRRKLGLA
jgi:hypothetical protein